MIPSITGGESRVGQFPRAAIHFETPIPTRQPDHAADRRQHHHLGEELEEDVAAPAANGHANADLARALGDGDEHHVGDPNAADDERDRGHCLEQRGDGLGALLRRLLHLRQVADLEIGLRLVGEAVPLAEQKERIEAARITAGASEPQLPVADGLSEVASFVERFEAEQKRGRRRTMIELPSAARRWSRDSAPLIRRPIGHFYFAGDRPFLLCFDILLGNASTVPAGERQVQAGIAGHANVALYFVVLFDSGG